MQSSTLKSYISAVKSILKEDNYIWGDSRVTLNVFTRACKIKNGIVKTRLPIQKGLLESILFELEKMFDCQPYLETLYKALDILRYYGLMHVGELTQGPHVVKSKDMHIGRNKNKLLIVFYTSKTHGLETSPQQIKILQQVNADARNRLFCPFRILQNYSGLRGNFLNDSEQFFIFQGNVSVQVVHMRRVLRSAIKNIGLEPYLYDTHSLRSG